MGITHYSGLAIGPSSNTDTQAGITQIRRYTVQFTEPDMSSGPAAVDSSYTVTGVTTGGTYFFTPSQPLSTGYGIGDVRCSTANELLIRWTGNSASSLSGSTNRGTLVQIDFSST